MESQHIDVHEVTVDCWGGQTATMMLVSDLGEVALVCKPEEFLLASVEKRCPITIGFKKKFIHEIGKQL